MSVKINPSWLKVLENEFEKPYFTLLTSQVKEEYAKSKVFPDPQNIFRAFDLTPFDYVKVVILGQDPYHTPGVADGLAFSTKPGNRVPPSLQNIYKEIITEFSYNNYPYLNDPDLTRWATQGVLLLNNTLTVRSGEPNSHSKFGWDIFTNEVIQIISREKSHVVFLLWGKFAQSKKLIIESLSANHLVLESAHPSPFSADKGFFGNNHFKQTNDFLIEHDEKIISW
ncbi:MAG: uracil-DNA glycosylase [candidate division SR1 bacterium]|nr:uracil-DNA glycosylase [candidate division SR1 bacterium]